MNELRKYLFLILILAPAWPREHAAEAGCKVPPPIPVCSEKLKAPAPPGDLSAESPLRQKIVDAAISKIGTVSDTVAADCNKQGWRELAKIYAAAYDRELTPAELKIVKRPLRTRESVTKLNDWCGIFALWAVKQGARAAQGEKYSCGKRPPGLDGVLADLRGVSLGYTRWTADRPGGAGIDGLPFKAGTEGIKPGDIVAIQSDNSHHALVERVVGNRIYTIDGNMDCQMIIRKERDLSQVLGYYPVE